MSPSITLLVITIFTIFQTIQGHDCPAGRVANHHEAQLQSDLLCAYDSSYRPVKDHRSAVNVSVRFSLKYISFDSLEETFTVHSWVAMKWVDEFLKWDPSDYGNITELQMESHNIWTPRMSLYNADAMMYQSDQIYSTCLVESGGNVTCVPHVPYSGICRTSLAYWPYDQQNCSLYFGSWMHTGEQINFKMFSKAPVLMDNYQNGPGWKLLKVVHDRLPGKYAANVTYPMLKYTFVMRRESEGLAAMLVVPSMIVMILTLVSCLLDVKDNTRLSMQCFSLFGHFIFLTEIGYSIPKHGAETPVLILFVRDSMMVTLASILLTLLLMSLRSRLQVVPQWLKSVVTLVTSGPGRYVVFTEFDPRDAEDKRTLPDSEPEGSKPRATADWVNLANVLNSFIFLVFVLVYIVLLSIYIPRDK